MGKQGNDGPREANTDRTGVKEEQFISQGAAGGDISALDTWERSDRRGYEAFLVGARGPKEAKPVPANLQDDAYKELDLMAEGAKVHLDQEKKDSQRASASSKPKSKKKSSKA